MKVETTNPYVGLRPFDVDESLLFFGRNDQTLELLQRLHQHHFVAVVGSSGCGKSSLLRAGLIPALKAGYLVDDSDNWFIAIMKPGQNPLYNLAESILLQINPQTDSDAVSALVKNIEEEGADVIINLISTIQKEKNINFFLLVDQFEELFRFAMDQKDVAKKDEAIDFVNIMLELSQQSVIPFYVVITMRSDFIGDCSQFYGLPEAMNKSQYLVPRLNRVQLKMVIEGPAKLYGGKLDSALTSLLLNELGKVKDELPLLQHALMRIWDYEERINKSGALDLEDYSKIGGIEKALSFHADEALAGMSKEEEEIAKQLFKALTAIDDNGRKIRRPVLFSQLNDLTAGTEEQLRHIIDMFIKDKRSFLIINKTGDSGDEIIDISHESLIRQWDTLCKWVEEEGESASVYLQLIEASKLNKKGKKDFLTGSELQLALEWREKFKSSAIWANRYKEGFEECMAYLNASEAERTRLNNIEIKRKQTKRKLVLSIMGILLFSAIGGLILYGNAIISEEKAIDALTKSEKLVNAFYFYHNKFALAFSNERDFYFIDKNGNRIEKLKKWKKAEQFDDYGYAKVKGLDEIDYMLDTAGNSYKAAFGDWGIETNTEAVDLSNQLFDKVIPNELFSAKKLKILYLGYNQLDSLPVKIGELKNLTALSLDFNQLTTLPNEIGELKKLTSLGLSSNQLTTLPAEFWELKNLTDLGLSSNYLDSLPQEIGNLENLNVLLLDSNLLNTLPAELWELKNLTMLGLSGNKFTSLPKEIRNLENLKSLILDNNQLVDLPNEFWELKHLIDLGLGSNKFSNLPQEIGMMKNLSKLNLSNNDLTTLPEDIWELKNLTELNLSSNKFSALPKEIGYLNNMTGLSLSKNNLSVLPKEIRNLEKLTVLMLDSNQLTTFPKEITELKYLYYLYLSHNQLTDLPQKIGELKNLSWLLLDNNQFTSLPSEIGELKNLNVLYLSGNQLTSLPKEIGKLKNLTDLIIDNNQITSLPKEIDELKNLSTLYLTGNKFTNLPTEIGELNKLTGLDVSYNQLTALLPEIGKLENLYYLFLQNNQLKNLPKEIAGLENLNYLNLSNNQFTSVPIEIGMLKNLYLLDFSGNQITNLPAKIGELQYLSSLDLSNNRLTILPEGIKELVYLSTLNLSNNQLNSLPKEIGKMEYLYSLDLSGNQLTSLPEEIGKLQYLYSLNLTGNNISKTEIEKIRRLLPNCEIITENSSDFENSLF